MGSSWVGERYTDAEKQTILSMRGQARPASFQAIAAAINRASGATIYSMYHKLLRQAEATAAAATAAAATEPRLKHAMRTCLGPDCGRSFDSEHAGNRICPGCAQRRDYEGIDVRCHSYVGRA
jgi:hypothetical protein